MSTARNASLIPSSRIKMSILCLKCGGKRSCHKVPPEALSSPKKSGCARSFFASKVGVRFAAFEHKPI